MGRFLRSHFGATEAQHNSTLAGDGSPGPRQEIQKEKDETKVNAPITDPAIKCASWLRGVLDHKILPYTVRRLVQVIRESGLRFDAIAFRGLSGSLVVSSVSMRLRKGMIAVRKKHEKRHSSYLNEGAMNTKRYIIVDDIIDSGTTIKDIHSRLGKRELVGIFLYDSPRKDGFDLNSANHGCINYDIGFSGGVPVFAFDSEEEYRARQKAQDFRKGMKTPL